MQSDGRRRLKPFIAGGVLLVLLVAIFLVISLAWQAPQSNQFGAGTKIDNLASEYSNLPKVQSDMIANALYETILYNSSGVDEVPESGAVVREGTAEYTYNEENRVYEGDFIVDIPSVEQSYRIHFRWSTVNNNLNLDGYPVVVTCLPSRLQIYDGFSCKNLIEMDSFWENAFQLDYILGLRTSAIVRNKIASYLIGENEEEDGYTIVIDEPTLKRDKRQQDLVFSFSATLNQKLRFDAVIRVDSLYGDEYIAIYISMSDKMEGFILTDDKDMQEVLSDWLRMVSGNDELNIGVDKLEDME